MSYWSLVHFFGFATYLYIAVYILLKNSTALLNRICAFNIFLFSVWSFGTTFLRNPAASYETVTLFNNIASIGWIGFASVFLLFVLIYTEKSSVYKSVFFNIFLFTVPLVLIFCQWQGEIIKGFQLESYGWVGVWSKSLCSRLFYVYYITCCLAGLYLLRKFWKSAAYPTEKNQSRILFLTVFISLIVASFASVILRSLNIYSVPPLGDFFSLPWALGLFYATARYRLFELTPSLAAGSIVETMSDSLILVDVMGNISMVNSALLSVLGYNNSDLLGKPVTMLLEGRNLKGKGLKQLFEGDGVSNLRMDLVAKNGSKIPILLTASKMKGDGGSVSGFVCVAHDCTEIITVHEELEKSLDNTRKILEGVPFGIMLVGRDKKIRMANRAALKMLEVKSSREIIGDHCHDHFCPDDKHECPVLDCGEIVDNSERVLVSRSGKHIPIIKNVLPINLSGEDVLLEAFIDIMEQKRYREELIFAKEAAEGANMAKSAFLANMSHEIRTPMNSIIGFANLLLINEKDQEKKEQLKIITQSGENLLKIINDILDFSKIEAEKVILNRGIFSLRELLNNIRKIFSQRAGKKNISFEINISDSVPAYVIGDEHRINQVLVNLVDNAIKFTSEGGITVSGDYSDGIARIIVKDTGIGISEDNIELVFSAFDQVDPTSTREFGGTGLGLSISRNLAEMMGGGLSVESELNSGSAFILELPLAESGESSSGKEKNNEPGDDYGSIIDEINAGDDVSGFNILVIEDNEMNRKLMARLLTMMGVSFSFAVNGKEALEMLMESGKGDVYDLALLDIQMPVMDGLETLKHIRNNTALQDLCVVALTAHAMEGDSEKYRNIGFDDYISKPIDMRFFFRKINKIMKEIRKQGE